MLAIANECVSPFVLHPLGVGMPTVQSVLSSTGLVAVHRRLPPPRDAEGDRSMLSAIAGRQSDVPSPKNIGQSPALRAWAFTPWGSQMPERAKSRNGFGVSLFPVFAILSGSVPATALYPTRQRDFKGRFWPRKCDQNRFLTRRSPQVGPGCRTGPRVAGERGCASWAAADVGAHSSFRYRPAAGTYVGRPLLRHDTPM
jgi:hypothetical protein